jgi:hypothetical protein
MIFGDENAHLFNNPKGMIAWNKSLYEKINGSLKTGPIFF